MAFIYSGGKKIVASKAKTTRQGSSKNTSYSPTSNSHRTKKYRGQGRRWLITGIVWFLFTLPDVVEPQLRICSLEQTNGASIRMKNTFQLLWLVSYTSLIGSNTTNSQLWGIHLNEFVQCGSTHLTMDSLWTLKERSIWLNMVPYGVILSFVRRIGMSISTWRDIFTLTWG